MNQIRTYSKTRPKSVILYEKEDTIFQSIDKKSKSDNGSGDIPDNQELILKNSRKKRAVGGRKMRPVINNKNCQRTLKSRSKIVGHKTTPLKRNPTETMQSLKRQSNRKIKKQKQSSQNTKQSTKFTWPESDNDEPGIEIFRKDEGMTWQQKISFLLPKMHEEYTNKGPIHRETYRGKISSPLLNISAEEVEEDTSEGDSEDYTFTWVTATNTKSHEGQSPSTKFASYTSQPNSTLVAVGTSKTRTGKLKLPEKNLTKSITIHDPSVNEFLDKDKDGISINQKWNSTIQKNAQNIKECGFPVDVSSIKLCQSGSKKTSIQLNQETTPDKGKILHREPSRPKKKKIVEKHFNSTKMFLSDHFAFVDMVPEMSTIYKVSGKTDDSIEVTRDKSPFVKLSKAESPITPFISPKRDDNEPVFTSTPTKGKDHKVKEFPEFDLSSVQIPEFEEDELEIHESREVNSDEIVCELTEEDLEILKHLEPIKILEKAPCDKEVLQPQIDILNDEKIENHSKKSTKLSQNSTIKPVFETDRCNKDKDSFQNDEDLIPVENLTVIPMKQSSESRQNIIHQSFCGNKTKMNRTKDFDVEECCIAAFKVPLKPLRKFKTCIDYEHILKTTPIDCIQQIF